MHQFRQLPAGGVDFRAGWTGQGRFFRGGGPPAITYDWFRTSLQVMLDREWRPWFARLVVIGEFLVGAGLILGALVGLATFGGSLMNFTLMLAGASSASPACRPASLPKGPG